MGSYAIRPIFACTHCNPDPHQTCQEGKDNPSCQRILPITAIPTSKRNSKSRAKGAADQKECPIGGNKQGPSPGLVVLNPRGNQDVSQRGPNESKNTEDAEESKVPSPRTKKQTKPTDKGPEREDHAHPPALRHGDSHQANTCKNQTGKSRKNSQCTRTRVIGLRNMSKQRPN